MVHKLVENKEAFVRVCFYLMCLLLFDNE